MTPIAEWLTTLGLARYAPQFDEQEVTLKVLPSLTDQDLKDLGVALLGHRRTMMMAIAQFVPAPAETAASAPPPQSVESQKAAVAERRQLTVMFCDLVGSTALTATKDPEEVREIVRAYQRASATAVARYEGFVAQYLGDGIMAYFGYPAAHEDDAERAVRAGLDMIAAVRKLESKLEARIGIATGLVVVGDLIGEHAAKERAVTGETPNLAARLQGLAAPGSIVISAATRRLLGGQFDLHDLGPNELKGLAAPVNAFAVAGVRSFESRFEARAGGLTGFVGRDDECQHLLSRWKLARQGRGQVAVVSGEAGIGKSRLTAWLVDKIGTEPHTRLRYQCTPHHRDSALYPTIVQLERAAAFGTTDTHGEKLAKLEAVLALAGLETTGLVPLFAALLVIPTDDKYPPLGMTPAQQRQQTMAAMLEQIEGLARQKPLLMLYEDAHWADATSLELLDTLVDRIARLSVLLVVTGRPEFKPAWAGRHNVSTATLQRLDRRHASAMVEAVTGGAALPPQVMEQILAKTDGVPLFVEELTKTVLESGQLVEQGASYHAAGSAPAFAIPATLQDSLMARLDRLNPVKEVAQIGAAIGREFSAKVLIAVVRLPESTIRDALAKLEEAELATHRGAWPDATYVFKHALVQDAAYEGLLKSRRQVIHSRIAKAMRDKFPILADTEPETVAHHFTAAGKAEQAANWWTKAGNLAAARGGFVEAIGHFERAIALADTLPPTPERLQARLALQLAYREPVIAIHGWSAQKTTDAFVRSSQLASQLDDPRQRFASAFGTLHAIWAPGEVARALPLAEDYLRQALELGDETQIMVGHRLVGQIRLYAGDFTGAIEELRIALAAYSYDKHADLTKHHGADDRTSGQCFLAVALWLAGQLQESRVALDEVLAHSYRTNDIPSIAFALGFKPLHAAIRGDIAETKTSASLILQFSQKNDLVFWMIMSQIYLSSCRRAPNELDISIDEIIKYNNMFKDMRFGMQNPILHALWADLVAEREPAEGIAILDNLLVENSRSGDLFFDAALHRRRGQYLLRMSPPDLKGAETAFRQAISVARTQGARTYELLASLDLARLYCDTAREQEAHDILAPALVGFEPTPELAAIAEAQRLLASLGQGLEARSAAARL